jgi:gamma-glutamyltranspeptidase / glutathione hydrolase
MKETVDRFKRIIALILVFSIAGPAGALQKADLSPKKWPAAEAAVYSWLDTQYGQRNVLAEGKNGVIAGTTSASAQRAGLEALRQGGSAADAVLTASLAQISQAMGSWVSYAGILTLVYYESQTGRFHCLNAGFNTVLGENDPMSIPALADPLSPRPDAEIRPSGRTALVPGYMAGVQAAHARFGKLAFEDLFAPAIHFAESGFPLSPFQARLINLRKKVLTRLPETKAIFTKPDGTWYTEGDLFRQPALAETLRRIARKGAAYMYTGDWGRKLAAVVGREGGRMTEDDLKSYQVIWSDPLAFDYGEYRIHAPGLPGQGGVHLAEALNVARQAGLAGRGRPGESPEAFFWLSQITNLMALSFLPPQMVSGFLGGADASPAARVGEDHARRIWSLMAAGRFPLTRVPAEVSLKHSDAVVAVDRWGNVAALVHTSNTVVWGTTGIFVDGISIPDPASVQQALVARTGPGKRLPDPTEPLIVARDGRPVAALSSIGAGLHQKTVSVLMDLLDFKRGLKAAVDAPSLNAPAYGSDGRSRPQVLEGDFYPGLLDAVRKMGLDVIVSADDPVSRVPRGYTIGGFLVGAFLDPKAGFQAVAPGALNGRALGY